MASNGLVANLKKHASVPKSRKKWHQEYYNKNWQRWNQSREQRKTSGNLIWWQSEMGHPN